MFHVAEINNPYNLATSTKEFGKCHRMLSMSGAQVTMIDPSSIFGVPRLTERALNTILCFLLSR